MTRLPDITTVLLVVVALCSGTKADCPQGQYRASSGLCCLLCDAGTFKIEDCSTDGGYAHCLSCFDGKYTDRDNQETWCLTCTVCGQHEVIQQDCKATQNRKCVCDVGFYRPENGDPCQEESHVGVIIAAITAGVLGSAFFGGVVYLAYWWRRRRRNDAASRKKALEEVKSLCLNGVHKNGTVQQPQPRDKLETFNEQGEDQEQCQLKEKTIDDDPA